MRDLVNVTQSLLAFPYLPHLLTTLHLFGTLMRDLVNVPQSLLASPHLPHLLTTLHLFGTLIRDLVIVTQSLLSFPYLPHLLTRVALFLFIYLRSFAAKSYAFTGVALPAFNSGCFSNRTLKLGFSLRQFSTSRINASSSLSVPIEKVTSNR